MAKPKLFVVGADWGYSRPWAGRNGMFKLVDSLYKADAFLFTGGADISPEIYGEEMGMRTFIHPERDRREIQVFNVGVEMGKAMIGICRGAQLLTALNGGKLVQHVSNHGGSHPVHTLDGREFIVSSTHHQMMNPFGLPKKNYKLLAWANKISHTYLDGDGNQIRRFWTYDAVEPEVVVYPNTRCLCIQAHPEIMPSDSRGVKQFQNWAKEFII